jgi:hypothetical protein
MADAFLVLCAKCGARIKVTSVSIWGLPRILSQWGERRTPPQKTLHSYGYCCPSCGTMVEVDGVKGGRIPDSMRREAQSREEASHILREIDHARRALPPAESKSTLRSSRLDPPQKRDDGAWYVYELPKVGAVLYDPSTGEYTLPEYGDRRFSSVKELVAFWGNIKWQTKADN